MKLHIENISKIEQADINIEGITVIAGSNNTGKSTIGKVLYALINSFYNMDAFIADWKPQDARQELKKSGANLDLICKKISGVKRRKISTTEQIQSYYAPIIAKCTQKEQISRIMGEYCLEHLKAYGIEGSYGQNEVQSWLEEAIIDISKTILEYNSEYAEKIGTQNYWRQIFGTQINRVLRKEEKVSKEKACAVLTLNRENSNTIGVEIVDERIKSIQEEFKVDHNALYIDNPRVLNEFPVLGLMSELEARRKIEAILTPCSKRNVTRLTYNRLYGFQEVNNFNMDFEYEDKNSPDETNVEMQEMDEMIERLDRKLVSIMHGGLDFSKDRARLDFNDDDYTDNFILDNLSTGVKAVSLLQSLLHYRVLKKKGVLILDEPEINLHPEWQVEYAKVIARLQKDLELHVVITTHSPFFLKAIQNAVEETGMNQSTHYYFSDVEDGKVFIENVDEDLGKIYNKMMKPLLKMLKEIPL